MQMRGPVALAWLLSLALGPAQAVALDGCGAVAGQTGQQGAVLQAGRTVRVTADATPVYEAADPASRVVVTVPMGATLDAIGEAGEWYRVRQRSTGAEGFVRKSAVELLPGPGPGAAVAPRTEGTAPGGREPSGLPRAGAQKPGMGPPAAAKAARREPGWTDRAYLAVSGVYQASSRNITDTFAYPVHAEDATVTTHYAGKGSTGFDAGGGLRLWRSLALGLQISAVSRTDPLPIEATVPHPLYLRQDRSLSGGAPPGTNRELGVHLQVAWVVPVGARLLVTLAAGPSWIQTRRTVVEEIRWTDVYPYDSATFEGADTKDVEVSRVGFNAGVDVAYYLTGMLGAGASVRYAGANVRVPLRGSEQTHKAGGAQAAVGLRIRFGRPAPAPKPRPQPPPVPRRK